MSAATDHILAGLNNLAAKDFGLMTRDRAIEAGLKPYFIDRLLASRRWTVVFPSVYALGPVDGSRLAKLRAALLWYGEGGVLSHSTAAELYELDGIPRFYRIHLLRQGLGKRRRHEAMRCHGTRSLPDADVTQHRGFAVTTVPRTLVDLASMKDVSLHQLELAALHAIRRGYLSVLDLVARVAAESSRKTVTGIEKLEQLIAREALLLRIESELEARFVQLLIDEGLRPPETQCVLEDFAGAVGRFDLVYRRQHVLVEVDGRSAHEATRQRERDREKDQRASAVGYIVLRARHEQLAGPPRRAFLAGLRAALLEGPRWAACDWPYSRLLSAEEAERELPLRGASTRGTASVSGSATESVLAGAGGTP